MARDFVSPFNVVHFQRNLQQIHELEKREDYIGVWRAISLSYTRALKTVQGHSFESKQPIAEKKVRTIIDKYDNIVLNSTLFDQKNLLQKIYIF